MANVINSLKLGDGTYVFTTPYATCSTDAAAVAKAATITPASNFSLETGARVAVKFANDNTAGSPTLNVNSTGAKPIYFKNAALAASNYWSAGQVVDFIYDGTNWVCSAVVTDNNFVTLSGAQTISGNKTFNNHIILPNGPDGYIEFGNWRFFGYSLSNNANSTSLSFPSGKNGTIATTSDIPDTSNFATLSGNNTFTGITAFNNTVSCGTIISNSGFMATNNSNSSDFASFEYNSITRSTNSTTYTLTLPTKSGTIALTSDIPDTSDFASLSGANEFTGPNTFTTNVTVKSSNSLIAQGSTALNHTDYSFGKIVHTPDATKDAYTLTLPSKSGTLATTSDIPIKSATLSGTTLSITLS